MSYQAICAPAKVRQHPNADRLKLLIVAGHQVCTNANIEEGQLMVFFPEGGALSEEFLYENSEYREGKGKNRNPKSFGYFETNGRVRTIKLRGERSEGYAVSPSTLAWTGYDLSTLTAGQQFDTLNGHVVCKKYVSPATQRAIDRAAKQGKKRLDPTMFKQHFDTKKLRYNLHAIPDGARVILTEKIHGTSGRTGRVLVETPVSELPWYQRAGTWLYNLIAPKQIETISQWEVVTGTRRVVLQNGEEGENGFYKDMNFRQVIHEDLKPRLRKGETLYYEIGGYDERGGALFYHSIPDDKDGKRMQKQYGDKMIYSYGQVQGQCGVFIYRITQTNEDGQSTELSWEQVKARCHTLGLKHVPELGQFEVMHFNEDLHWIPEHLVNNVSHETTFTSLCNRYSTGPSTVDPSHITEGVCVRVEHMDCWKTFKYKSFDFCHLEGIRKNSDDYIDIEEIS